MRLRSSRGVSRAFGAAVVAALLSVSTSSVAHDKELLEASDFRVRVQAALRLGKTDTPESRADLERGLRDSHPAVRVACAVALGDTGNRGSIGALERAVKTETFASVKSSMKASIDKLRAARPSEGGAIARTKYVVQLGRMNNTTGVRDRDLSVVMQQAARAKASAIHGAVVVDSSDTAALKSASENRIPVLLVDGSLTRLTQSRGSNGGVVVSAQVDLSIRKIPQQVLQGMVSGNASAVEEVTRGGTGLSELQDRAVGGAIESAMSSMGSEIKAFTK